jgi:hypothetical protein
MHRLILIVLCALIPAAAQALYIPATDERIGKYMSMACEYLPEAKDCSKLENPSILFADLGRPLGLYHYRTRLVHITENCLENVSDQTLCAAVLVHEMAHYILDWTADIQGCESERIAWRVYNEYVEDQGRKDLLVADWRARYPQCANQTSTP